MIFEIIVGIVATMTQLPTQDGRIAATQMTGKLLYEQCSRSGRESTSDRDRDVCMDYIFSVVNVIDARRLNMSMKQCVPPDADPSRLRKVIAARLKFDRAVKNEDPAGVVALTILDLFDCTSGKPRSGLPAAGGAVFSHGR